MTNMDTNSLLGLGTAGNGIRVQKTVNINAPIDEVYRFWHNFENFPLFMDHVKEVSVQNGISTWKVAVRWFLHGIPIPHYPRCSQ